jgi:hypothetical protein
MTRKMLLLCCLPITVTVLSLWIFMRSQEEPSNDLPLIVNLSAHGVGRWGQILREEDGPRLYIKGKRTKWTGYENGVILISEERHRMPKLNHVPDHSFPLMVLYDNDGQFVEAYQIADGDIVWVKD